MEAVAYLPFVNVTSNSLNFTRLGAAALDGFCSKYGIWLFIVQGDLKDRQPFSLLLLPLPVPLPTIFLPSFPLNSSLLVQLKRKERTMEVSALLSSGWQEVLGYRGGHGCNSWQQ